MDAQNHDGNGVTLVKLLNKGETENCTDQGLIGETSYMLELLFIFQKTNALSEKVDLN